MKVLKAGLLYFALVSGAGFRRGPVRILWAVPRFGERTAELRESPALFAVFLAAARWVVRSRALPPGASSRLRMAGVAFGLRLAAENPLVLWHRGRSVRDSLAPATRCRAQSCI